MGCTQGPAGQRNARVGGAKMKQIIRIAFRNVSRQKRRTFLLAGAVMFAFAVIILVNSFANGLVDSTKQNFSSLMGGHIFISGSELTERGTEVYKIADDKLIKNVLDQYDEDISRVQYRSTAFSEFIFASKRYTQRLLGVDFEKEENVLDSMIFLEGSADMANIHNPVFLTKDTAEFLNVHEGDEILVTLNTVTGQKNTGDLTVAGIFEDTINAGTSSAFVKKELLNRLIGLDENEFQMVGIELKNEQLINVKTRKIYYDIKEKASVEIREDDPEYEAESQQQGGPMGGSMMMAGLVNTAQEPWEGTKYTIYSINDQLEGIVSVITGLKVGSFFVFLLVLVITGIGITNTFRMVLLERIKEIGTIRAIGLQRSDVRGIFIMEAMFVCLLGVAAGLVLSIIIIGLAGLIQFPADNPLSIFMSGGKLSFVFNAGEFIGYTVVLILICLLSVIFPANRAARLEPSKALRTTV